MRSFTTRSCNKITTANTLKEPLMCLECRSTEVTLYDDPSLSFNDPGERGESHILGDFGLETTRSYLCPQCGNYAVVYEYGGKSFD